MREKTGAKGHGKLKAALKQTSPGKLVRTKAYTAFRAIDKKSRRPVGPKLQGVARLLSEKIWSSGRMPASAHGSDFRGSHWKGEKGGLNRGKAVDAQVSRLVNAGSWRKAKLLRMSRFVFSALDQHGIDPISAQRVVLDASKRLATAADIVGLRGNDLVLVELKTGCSGDKLQPALKGNTKCYMASPCSQAYDTVLHRHLAQLSATLALFTSETTTLNHLKSIGIGSVQAALLYVSENGSELHALDPWWIKRGKKLLDAIA